LKVLFAFALFGCVIVKDVAAEIAETYTPDVTSAAAVDDVGVNNTVEFAAIKGTPVTTVVAELGVKVNVPTE
jgi:hypothetical protein